MQLVALYDKSAQNSPKSIQTIHHRGGIEGKLTVWTESTTTSPPGLHLGHYKALIVRHSFQTDASDDELTTEFKQQRDELDLKQKELRDIHLGYSYNRWHTIANTILFKDSDNVCLHRTRVIHIYEADFNLALGVKWREAMHKAEDSNALTDHMVLALLDMHQIPFLLKNCNAKSQGQPGNQLF